MNFNRIVEKYKEVVFGSDTTFDVQKRIFLLVTHISFIIAFVGVVTNILLGLNTILTLITVLAFLIILYLHVQVKKTQLDLRHSIGFLIISVITFSFLWFFNGGYNGNNSVLIFVYFIVVVTILPAKLRLVSFYVYSIMIVGLITVQYLYPHTIIPYHNEHQRYIDLALGYFLYIILAYNIQNTILKNYDIEHERVKIKSNQLSDLIQQLNITNQQLEESIQVVEELNASKDRFITVLSHDLRSPFQGLLGITKTLEADYSSFSDEDKRFYISQANKSLDKIYSFLEELLLWGRVQRNAVKLNYELCSLKEVLTQTLILLYEGADKKKISIDVKCDESLVVLLDKEMISIVLRNLISNAIKFSPVGSRIKINAGKENNELKISVVDEGVGIPEEYIPKLFKLDENISTVGTDGEIGSGMGLILCSDILKKHHGKITVQSKEGRGSTFIVTLSTSN
jgi:signal transduction histidine kinase